MYYNQEADPVRGICGAHGEHEIINTINTIITTTTTTTARVRDVRKTRGGRGLREGVGKRVNGVFVAWTTSKAFAIINVDQ